ncbi:MAG: Heavy metal efflux outer membrane protein CzcC family [Myxococcales bacterium]|nr:Heavy metal efflux outer membrane protein CzcC family [Myxococcales bacterium]
MKRLSWILKAMLVALSFPSLSSRAQAAEEGGPLITLDGALAMAKKANHTLGVERARLAQAQTNVEQAWTSLFPTIGAQAKYTHNYKEVKLPFGMGGAPILLQPSEQLDFGVNATVPLLVPAAYPALDAVKKGVSASEAGYDVSQSEVLVGVARAYLAAAVSDEVLVARRSSIDVARATLGYAHTRQEAGTVTKVDVDRAELAVVRAEQLEREANYGKEQAYRALGTLIGQEGPFRIQLEASTAPLPDGRDVAGALSLRPEFRVLEATVASADAQSRARAWQWSPSISGFGNARKFNYQNFAQDRYSWAVGAQLDWLIFDGGSRDAQRHAANAQVQEAQSRVDVLRETIRDDLANGVSEMQTKKRGVEAAERALALSREALELVRVQYEAGTGTQLDLLQAQDAVVGAHLGLAQAHFDVAAADLALRHAAGTFPPK